MSSVSEVIEKDAVYSRGSLKLIEDQLCIVRDVLANPRVFKILRTLKMYYRLTVSDLRKLLKYSDASMRGYIKKLITLRLCEHVRGYDLRKKYIKLTELGERILDLCEKVLINDIKSKFGVIDDRLGLVIVNHDRLENFMEIYGLTEDFLKEQGYALYDGRIWVKRETLQKIKYYEGGEEEEY